ncbi:MAG: hypothetical protein ACOCP4_02935 [Candidatus Woesearchaeota archaeon]
MVKDKLKIHFKEGYSGGSFMDALEWMRQGYTVTRKEFYKNNKIDFATFEMKKGSGGYIHSTYDKDLSYYDYITNDWMVINYWFIKNNEYSYDSENKVHLYDEHTLNQLKEQLKDDLLEIACIKRARGELEGQPPTEHVQEYLDVIEYRFEGDTNE